MPNEYYNAIKKIIDNGEILPHDPVDDAGTNTPEEQAYEDELRKVLGV